MPKYLVVSLCLAGAPLSTVAGAEQPQTLQVTANQLEWVGGQVFRNECDSRPSCLVHWNRGEPFPSLGIGHFIWYPAGEDGPFVESFPSLLNYMSEEGVALPDWLIRQAPAGAPWPDRDSFLKAQPNDPRIPQLRQLLLENQASQVAFMLSRARAALSRVAEASTSPGHTRAKIDALTATPGGIYTLIDYVNFKGEGLAESERYGGVGWGLLQVLESMPDDSYGGTELDAFREAAARVLTRRAERADRSIEREQWLRGWLKRVDSYREPGEDAT